MYSFIADDSSDSRNNHILNKFTIGVSGLMVGLDVSRYDVTTYHD